MEQTEHNQNPKAQKIKDLLCGKVHCSELGADLGRLQHAREMLAKLQQRDVFERLLEKIENPKEQSAKNSNGPNISSIVLATKQQLSPAVERSNDNESIHAFDESKGQQNENVEDSNDSWLGFFKGYQILSEDQKFCIGENKQCIEISHKDCCSNLEDYLRSGIRCYMIDLFHGTQHENQKLICKLRESELKISREYSFPITTTLFAMLSPRQQYTGMLESKNATRNLEKYDEIWLTTKRIYSSCGNRHKIYVNARFLIDDCQVGDFILMGPTIQLSITDINCDEIKCMVMEAGILHSRLPVRFPGRCQRCLISVEELEDITFAQEVGINVLVSYIPGTPSYLNDLYDTLRVLKCENLRICTRVVLNEINGENHKFNWIAERYDGFLIDLSSDPQLNKCLENDTLNLQPNILKLSPAALSLITKIYQLQKPIILNATLINDHQLFVQPHNRREIFYYPDKYIFAGENSRKSFSFYFLQNAIYSKISEMELSLTPYSDKSNTGSDILARSCVAASFECQAKAIMVCSAMTDMTTKLAHFRPQSPIIHISSTKSSGDYISMFHNLIFLYFPDCDNYTHDDFVTKAFIYGSIYLKTRKILKSNENVILVYGSKPDTQLPDKYVVFKFDDQKFAENLCDILFT